jgi:hypothetical protein
MNTRNVLDTMLAEPRPGTVVSRVRIRAAAETPQRRSTTRSEGPMINNRSMAGPRRVDTDWPQTDLIDRRRAPRTQREPPINWRNPFEVGGVIAAAIGITVLLGIVAGSL